MLLLCDSYYKELCEKFLAGRVFLCDENKEKERKIILIDGWVEFAGCWVSRGASFPYSTWLVSNYLRRLFVISASPLLSRTLSPRSSNYQPIRSCEELWAGPSRYHSCWLLINLIFIYLRSNQLSYWGSPPRTQHRPPRPPPPTSRTPNLPSKAHFYLHISLSNITVSSDNNFCF